MVCNLHSLLSISLSKMEEDFFVLLIDGSQSLELYLACCWCSIKCSEWLLRDLRNISRITFSFMEEVMLNRAWEQWGWHAQPRWAVGQEKGTLSRTSQPSHVVMRVVQQIVKRLRVGEDQNEAGKTSRGQIRKMEKKSKSLFAPLELAV